MRTRLVLVASALVLAFASAPTLAYVGHREVVVPDEVWEDVTGSDHHAGLAVCERLSDDIDYSLSDTLQLHCEQEGFGAVFADIGCSSDFLPVANPAIFFGNGIPDNDQTAGNGFANSNPSTTACLDDLDGALTCVVTDAGNDCDMKDDYAHGTVTVSFAVGFFGDVTVLVGNDRDDDGFITTTDVDGSNDPTDENGFSSPYTDGTCNSDPEPAYDDPARDGCYDDEFISARGVVDDDSSLSVGFCFTRDRAEGAGDDWDEFAVFLGANIPGGDPPYIGTIDVVLDVDSDNDDCTTNSNRNAHADATRPTGGNPVSPGPPAAPGGVITLVNAAGTVSVVLDGTDLPCDYPSPVSLGSEVTVTCQLDFDRDSCDHDPASRYVGDALVHADAGLVGCRTTASHTCESYTANVVYVGTDSATATADCTGGTPAAATASGVANTDSADGTGGATEFTCSLKVNGIVAPGLAVAVCAVTFS